MNKFLLAIYRNDDYSLDYHLNRRSYSDRHDITEALKVLVADTDLEQEKRTKYAQTLLLSEADCNGKDGDGNPFLIRTCEQHDEELVNLFINFDCDVNATNEDGITALHAVAKGNSADLAGLLLSAGADVNSADSWGETPLMKALFHGPSEELFSILMIDIDLNACNSDYETALHIAVHVNLVREAAIIVGNGANVNAVDIDGNTPLHCACHHKVPDAAMIKLLLESKCDLNVKNRHHITPLFLLAINSSATKPLEMLLACDGLDLDPVSQLNQTPLFAAVQAQAFDNVKLLLQANCNVGFMGSLAAHGPYSKSCSLMDLALKIPSARLAKMLLLAGSCANGISADIEVLLADMDIATANTHENKDLQSLIKKPQPLQQTCRIIIRKAIGSHPMRKIQQLALPQSLRDFVTLKELESI